MYWTKGFIPTLKEAPQEAESVSHTFMLRAGLIRMLIAGVYTYLPLGLRVLNIIEGIIRQEMDAAGANELLLPALQPQELWVRSGRDKVIGEVMFRFQDRRGRKVCLGPTHEEVITELVKNHVSSYKQLPLLLYQIQTKFRDEIRPRFGTVRSCEFVMKDAYSFDADEEGLEKNYRTMYEAYCRIFARLGLDLLAVEADSGVMGGNVSHEFMVPAQSGEDVVLVCPQCKVPKPHREGDAACPQCKTAMETVPTIEVGHIFKLGTKYSASLGANFLDEKGQRNPLVMGCYGIGVSRLIPTVIEQNHDAAGIIWPDEVAPYKVIILPLDNTDARIMEAAVGIYDALNDSGVSVLMDDRNERAGVKFKDADLIGVPLQVVLGKESLKHNTVELKIRRTNEKVVDSREAIMARLKGTR